MASTGSCVACPGFFFLYNIYDMTTNLLASFKFDSQLQAYKSVGGFLPFIITPFDTETLKNDKANVDLKSCMVFEFNLGPDREHIWSKAGGGYDAIASEGRSKALHGTKDPFRNYYTPSIATSTSRKSPVVYAGDEFRKFQEYAHANNWPTTIAPCSLAQEIIVTYTYKLNPNPDLDYDTYELKEIGNTTDLLRINSRLQLKIGTARLREINTQFGSGGKRVLVAKKTTIRNNAKKTVVKTARPRRCVRPLR